MSLTSTFLLLAAGGAAACDNDDETRTRASTAPTRTASSSTRTTATTTTAVGGVGLLPSSSGTRPGYRSGYPVGTKLPAGGSKFAYNDKAARSAFGLPATGRIGNGTVKTSVVGKGGSGTGKSSSKSGG